MKNFMEPKSVALIGVGRKSGPGAFNLMENMLKSGFCGKIFPVNPNTQEILGERAYPNVKAVDAKMDLAVISTPRETTIDILRDCIAANIKAVIIVNQGFSDADVRGKEIQKEMTAIAKSNGIRLLGPNTLGVINNFNNFTTSFMPIINEKVPVGLICQSGIHFVGPRQFSGKIGKAIDLGNSCDIGFYDALMYFGQDPDIKVIAIHMEGLNQGKAFLDLARRVVKEKPIVIHKSGSSRTGAKAALSHTGSMAGNYDLLKGALKQTGVTFLEAAGEQPYAVKTLLNLPAMRGNRVAIVTFSGGAGIMGSDGLEKHGLKLVSLSGETTQAVAKLSPAWMPLGNPLDIWPAVMLHGARKAYSVALRAVLNDANVDGVICIAIAPVSEYAFLDVAETLNDVVAEIDSDTPVIAWIYGPNTAEVAKRLESKNRIMVYPTLEIATWALSLLRDRYQIISVHP